MAPAPNSGAAGAPDPGRGSEPGGNTQPAARDVAVHADRRRPLRRSSGSSRSIEIRLHLVERVVNALAGAEHSPHGFIVEELWFCLNCGAGDRFHASRYVQLECHHVTVRQRLRRRRRRVAGGRRVDFTLDQAVTGDDGSPTAVLATCGDARCAPPACSAAAPASFEAADLVADRACKIASAAASSR